VGTIEYSGSVDITPVFGLHFSKDNHGRMGQSRRSNCDQLKVSKLIATSVATF